MDKEFQEKLNRTIASNICRLLDENEKTKTDLAQFVGVSAATVSYWCKGEKMPRMNKIDMICRFFGVKRSEIMEEYVPFIDWTVKEGAFGGIENIMPELSITKKERALLVAFRNADEVTKKNICKILEVPDDEV